MLRAIARGGTTLACLLCLVVLAGCSGEQQAAGGSPSAAATASDSTSRTLAPVDFPDTQKVTGTQSGWTIQVPAGWTVLTPATIAEKSESELDELAGQFGFEAAAFRQFVAEPTLDAWAVNPDAVEEIRLTWYPSALPLGRADYETLVTRLGGSQHTTEPVETSTGFNTMTAFSDDQGRPVGRIMVGNARKGTAFLILTTEAEATTRALEELLVRGVTASP